MTNRCTIYWYKAYPYTPESKGQYFWDQ